MNELFTMSRILASICNNSNVACPLNQVIDGNYIECPFNNNKECGDINPEDWRNYFNA